MKSNKHHGWHAAPQETCFTLTLSDDGRGIDPDRIAEIALSKTDLYGRENCRHVRKGDPQHHFSGFLFHKKPRVSMLSGRGVGLAAVRAEVEALGGTIGVDSVCGQGTCFTMVLKETAEADGSRHSPEKGPGAACS